VKSKVKRREKQKIKNYLFPCFYILGWIGLFSLPNNIFHEGEGILRWLPFLLIFIVFPSILFKALEKLNLEEDLKLTIAIGSVFLGIPFGIIMGEIADKEIEIYGEETTGIIEDAWLMTRKSRSSIWAVNAKYIVNGKNFKTSTKENKERTYTKGDTITIIYSKKTPQLSEIKELMKNE
jgi:hypothetical protein